jgi:hypothetical protein
MEGSAPYSIAGSVDHTAVSWIVKLNTRHIRDNEFACTDIKHISHLQILDIQFQTD